MWVGRLQPDRPVARSRRPEPRLPRRIGRFLERQGLLERDAENSYLAGDDIEAGAMEQLLGSSITYRIAVGAQHGRKAFTVPTLPASDDPVDDRVGKVAGFSLHAGVAGPGRSAYDDGGYG